jgi:hypothetical protein
MFVIELLGKEFALEKTDWECNEIWKDEIGGEYSRHVTE